MHIHARRSVSGFAVAFSIFLGIGSYMGCIGEMDIIVARDTEMTLSLEGNWYLGLSKKLLALSPSTSMWEWNSVLFELFLYLLWLARKIKARS